MAAWAHPALRQPAPNRVCAPPKKGWPALQVAQAFLCQAWYTSKCWCHIRWPGWTLIQQTGTMSTPETPVCGYSQSLCCRSKQPTTACLE